MSNYRLHKSPRISYSDPEASPLNENRKGMDSIQNDMNSTQNSTDISINDQSTEVSPFEEDLPSEPLLNCIMRTVKYCFIGLVRDSLKMGVLSLDE